MMLHRYVLILVTLHPDMTDAVGNKYPGSGLVKCDNFVKDKDLRTGLFGTLWGKSESGLWFNKGDDISWAVIKSELNANMIALEPESYQVKFESGIVVHLSGKESCARFIANHQDDIRRLVDEGEAVQRGEIAGATIETTADSIETSAVGSHVLTNGYASRAITRGISTHAVNAGVEGVSTAMNDYANAVAMGVSSLAVTSGEYGKAIVTAPASRCRAIGELGKAIAVEAHSTAISSGVKGIAACLGLEGEGAAGDDGVLILAYDDGDRTRYQVGYVGEGIRANTVYRCDENGKFIEIL